MTQAGPDDAELRDTPASWPVSSTKVAFSGHVVDIRIDAVQMPDGATADREILMHPGAVGVLALDEAGRVMVLRQYRHAVGERLWELPAGLLDVAGEHPLVGARRELFEEAHLEADDWRVLVDAYTTPGMSDEAVRIFVARGARPVAGAQHARVHEEAEMELRWVALDDLVRGVLAGDLHNPLIVMGALALHAAAAQRGGLDALRPADAPWPARPF